MSDPFGLAPLKVEGGGWHFGENRPATAEEIAESQRRSEQEVREARRFPNRLKNFFHTVGRAWRVLWSGNDGW